MNAVFDKVRQLFKGKEDPRLVFMREHDIVWSETQGYIVKGVVLNETLAERLEYLSHRRLKKFDDLKELYFAAMLINEKIDLEIATGNYVARLGNTQENLQEFKAIVAVLGDYYREFLREKR